MNLSSSSTEEEEMDMPDACIFCNQILSKKRQEDGWIQCSICKEWAHEICSGQKEEDDDFVCDFFEIVKSNIKLNI